MYICVEHKLQITKHMERVAYNYDDDGDEDDDNDDNNNTIITTNVM